MVCNSTSCGSVGGTIQKIILVEKEAPFAVLQHQIDFFDELNNLGSDFSRLSTAGCKPSNTAVAQSNFGTEDTGRTMKMLAPTAVRLPPPVSDDIGNIMNSEYTDLCTGQTEFENHCTATTNDARSWVNCRVFSSFIRLQFR